MQLKSFLDRYDTVLLDMDGVVTSEEVYWNTAALTVWELLFSRRYFGTEDIDPAFLMARMAEIRKKVFVSDAVIKMVKTRGVNNNWDLAWFVIGGALAYKTTDFEEIFRRLSALPDTAAGMYQAMSALLISNAGMTEDMAAHPRGFWLTVQYAFQEWFLGSELFPKYWNQPFVQPGKTGLTFCEEPIVEKEALLTLFSLLSRTKRLGIGTGRPWIEMMNPLTRWKALDYFAPDALITYQDVQKAQASHPETVLTKPHPYMFLKGIFGDTYTDEELILGNFDPAPCKKTLVIGDAGCDLFAAKRASCDFAAVLTGIEGEGARSFFEAEHADYILHNILNLLEG